MSKCKHSEKVPRFYKVAATIAEDYHDDIGTKLQLVRERINQNLDLKALLSIVTTLFQKYREIKILLKRSEILKKESSCSPWLIKILIVELLWGKKTLMGQSKPENTVRGYEQILKSHLTDIIANQKEVPYKPLYVRVNPMIIPTEDAIKNFQNEGRKLLEFADKNDYDGFLKKISTIEEGEFIVDIHIPDVLIFSPKTDFYDHPAYRKISVFLQDKASCLPVHVLAPTPGSIVLDMCAGPGMKTTHLAALMNDEGTVYAVEKDFQRYKMLEGMIIDCASSCIKSVHKDVLDCTSKDFPGVEYILVDPSCSGTGIVNKYRDRKEISDERLRKLVRFQIKILRSALRRYPDAKRVVYSTSSIKPEENEDVVRQVIEKNIKFKLVPAKQFVAGNWKNFGSQDYGEMGAYCLYTRPEDDSTDGSFLAVFERLAEGEQNKFLNNKIYRHNIDKKARKKPKSIKCIDKEISHDDQTSELVKKKPKKKKHFEGVNINEENAVQETNEILEETDGPDESVNIEKEKQCEENCAAIETKTEKKRKKKKTKIIGTNDTNKIKNKKKKLQTEIDSSKYFEKQSKENKKKKRQLVRKSCVENNNEGKKKEKKVKEQQEKECEKFSHNKKIKKAEVKENLIGLDVTQYQQNALEKKKKKRKILEIIENDHNNTVKKKCQETF